MNGPTADTFDLPRLGGSDPGPIHTLVADTDRNLYYSDEFNHAVASLDGGGALRWSTAGRGSEPGRFWYPRGLSLGSIRIGGEAVQCLAVADAWNRRVQFFGLDGAHLAQWESAAGTPFAEVSDVRFIPEGGTDASGAARSGFWLVLDTGTHGIHAFGPDGSFLFRLGTGVPPHLARRWILPACAILPASMPSGVIEDYKPCDYIYYPSRILGAGRNIYVWEDHVGTLKRVLFGGFFPVRLCPKSPEVCIAADESGITGWNSASGCLLRYSPAGKLLGEFDVDGRPVFSDLTAGKLWIQAGRAIRRASCPGPAIAGKSDSHWSRFSGNEVPSGCPDDLSSLLDETRVHAAMTEQVRWGAPLLEIASGLLEADSGDAPASTEWRGFISRLESLQDRPPPIDLADALHDFCISALGLRLACACEENRDLQASFEKSRDTWEIISAPFREYAALLQRCIDDVFIARHRGVLACEGSSPEERDYAFGILQSRLEMERGWACRWTGYMGAPQAVADLPPAGESAPDDGSRQGIECAMLRMPGTRRYSHAGGMLAERDRIPLERYVSRTPVQPYFMAGAGEGRLYVSLFGCHQILSLDCATGEGFVIGREGTGRGEFRHPGGVTIDPGGRLWIADHYNHRVQVLRPSGEVDFIVGTEGDGVAGFRQPMGLCALPDESVLVADTMNHRIIRLSPAGEWSVFCNRLGSGPAEVRQPNSFCPAPDRSIWVVDRRNHRIQRLDPEGRFLGSVGSCGLGKGRLLLPMSAAMFADGTLAVSQSRPDTCVKLFSGDGRELERIPLDFAPAGLLVRGSHLLVADPEGTSIRIFGDGPR